MSYIGYQPKPGTYIKFDDISHLFNGSLTQFTMQQDGLDVIIPSLRQCIVSLNGVIQEPGVSIQAGSNSSKIQFSQAPQSGDTFWGMVFGTAYSISTVSDGAITAVKLDDGAVSTIKLQDGSVSTTKIANLAVTTGKIALQAVDTPQLADGAVTITKIEDNAVTYDKVASSSVATTEELASGTASKLVNAENLKEHIESNIITPWVEYTPIFTGLGTVTNIEMFSRRVGDTLHVSGRFQMGTGTATEARISLGFDGVEGGITVDASKVSSATSLAGTIAINILGTSGLYILKEGGVGYVTVGVQNASYVGLGKVVGSAVGANTVYGVDFSVPIAGW